MSQAPDSAVVLAGGIASYKGLTIAPWPKLFLPIANRPLYHYLAGSLGAAGVRRLIICVNAGLEPAVTDLLAASPPPLDYLVQVTQNGSGGSLQEVAAWIQGDSFWVVNGELLVGTDLTPMFTAHAERGAIATVGSCRVQEAPWWMERVETDDDQSIRAIHRIHPAQERRSTLRPLGIYLFQVAVLDFIPASGYFDLKEQLFPPLYDQGLPTRFWEIQGYCRTITSIEDYFFANQEVLLGLVQFPGMTSTGENRDTPPRPRVSASAKLYEPLALGPASSIGEGALILGPTAIGPHCTVEPGAIINECVILENTTIGRGAYLDSCIIGQSSRIKGGEILRETALMINPVGKEEEARLSLRARVNPSYGESSWQTPAGHFYLVIKRLLDIVVSSLLLILLTPLLVIVALVVWLDSRGAIIYRQERCGRKGRRFTMYKFRSMVDNAEALKRELQAMNEVDGPMFKMTQDPRVTRVGKFLRDTNLDELPQLFNVLRGDMSLVGPRPLSMEEMQYNPRWRDARLSVRPGVTGIWQVEAHTKVSFNDWIRYDIDYVQHVSFWLDLQILYKTGLKMVMDFIHKIKGKTLMKDYRALLMAMLVPLVMACGPGGKGTGVQQVAFPEMKPPPPGPIVVEPYRIMKGDTLSITFPLNPELDIKSALVRPDGRILLNLVGEVTAYGRTMPELQGAISQLYREFIAKTRYSRVLKEGDYFDLRFVYNPELNIGVRIQSDGKISLPIVGDIQAANLTPEELRRDLIRRYSRDINKPDIALLVGVNPNAFPMDIAAKKIHEAPNFITVSLVKTAGQYVFVGGEVGQARAVPWDGHLTALQAIAAAGGRKETGDLSRVVILRRGPMEQSEWILTDLASPMEGKDLKNDVALKAGDIVLVPMSGIAQVNLWVKQYIRDLIPLYGTYTISLGSASGAFVAPIP